MTINYLISNNTGTYEMVCVDPLSHVSNYNRNVYKLTFWIDVQSKKKQPLMCRHKGNSGLNNILTYHPPGDCALKRHSYNFVISTASRIQACYWREVSDFFVLTKYLHTIYVIVWRITKYSDWVINTKRSQQNVIIRCIHRDNIENCNA